MGVHASILGGTAMQESLSGYFNAEVDIVRATDVQDEYGEAIHTWAIVPELAALPALIAGGDVSIRLKKQEFRTQQEVYEAERRRVLLNAVYPAIDHKDRVRFESRDWGIVAIAPDPTGTFTELLCESIEPGDI